MDKPSAVALHVLRIVAPRSITSSTAIIIVETRTTIITIIATAVTTSSPTGTHG